MTNLDELINDICSMHEQLTSVFMRLLDVRDKTEYKSELWNELTTIINLILQIEHGGDHHAAV